MNHEIAVFGGGCFWCTEAIFKNLKGVISVMPGYAGGTVKNPSYEDVCTGTTGHAEVTKIEFDPTIIPYKVLVEVFMHTHEPTSLNKQGNDVGTQYRSIILYTNDEQKKIATEIIQQMTETKEFGEKPIVTEVKPLDKFYEAESYHQDYYAKNEYAPYCQLIISPKLTKLREQYSKLLK